MSVSQQCSCFHTLDIYLGDTEGDVMIDDQVGNLGVDRKSIAQIILDQTHQVEQRTFVFDDLHAVVVQTGEEVLGLICTSTGHADETTDSEGTPDESGGENLD